MELLKCSEQNVIKSCNSSHIEGKYVQRVRKISAKFTAGTETNTS
jgi:hypothetical protein